MSAQDVVYVVACNPFSSSEKDRPVRSSMMATLHLWALHRLQPTTSLSAVLFVSPQDETGLRPEIRHYHEALQATSESAFRLRLLRVRNNTLGSYGMYLFAFQQHHPRGDYYIMTEVDYVPWRAHFDRTLVRMYRTAFHRGTPGLLCGILCGLPADTKSPMSLYPESSQIMDSTSLQHVLRYTYETLGWNGSTASLMRRMVKVNGSKLPGRYNNIQEGFGLLMSASGVAMREYTAHYRTPYLVHWGTTLLDWSAQHNFSIPMSRVLFVPAQWLYLQRVGRCCRPRTRTWCLPDCFVADWRNGSDCCAGDVKALRPHPNASVSERRRRTYSDWQRTERLLKFGVPHSGDDEEAEEESRVPREQPPGRFAS